MASAQDNSPFAIEEGNRATVSLWMIMFSLIVFAAFSMVIMLAARVPVIANAVNSFLGLPTVASPDKPDRTTHLIFLLFCYSSPLMLAMWIRLLHLISNRWQPRVSASSRSEPDSPFA